MALVGPSTATVAAKLRSTSESAGSRIEEAKGLAELALTSWSLPTFPPQKVTEVPIEGVVAGMSKAMMSWYLLLPTGPGWPRLALGGHLTLPPPMPVE